MKRMFKILTWNANGLWQKLGELELFLLEKDIDVCLISETHVKQKSNLKIKGYFDYHAVHPSNKARGGASLYIKECIGHSIDLQLELETMQVSSVQVQYRHAFFKISSIYCPPRCKIEKNDYTNLINSLGQHFIIGGDFNAKHSFWGSRCISRKGRMLYEVCMQSNCDCHSTGKPTYWPTDVAKIPDSIDFFITKGLPANRVKVEESFDLSSDHSPVILTTTEALITNEKPPRLTNGKTDWKGFKKDVQDNTELSVSLKTPYELEVAVDRFVDIVQKAAWNNTPHQQRTPDYNCVKYPQEIIDMVKSQD